jgi:NAD(P)-dependent dehydrogenase (short-subunit alcohol dehydrogenase family)
MGVVLVTGAGSPVGLATALEFARRGEIVYGGLRDEYSGGELERAAVSEGLSVELIALDVTSERSVLSAVERILEEQHSIDVLVNAVEVALQGAVHLCGADEVRWLFETNVLGLVRVVRAVAPTLKRNGRGAIVNVGSVSGLVTRPYSGLYAASKHAVEAITEAMHFELQPWGIRVCVVEPGRMPPLDRADVRVAERQPPDSVEGDRAERFEAAVRRIAGDNPTPSTLVAKAIVAAADGGPHRLRYLVGLDTEADVQLGSRRDTDFEGYEEALRSALQWWD